MPFYKIINMDEVHKVRINNNIPSLVEKTIYKALVHSFERMDKANTIPETLLRKWKVSCHRLACLHGCHIVVPAVTYVNCVSLWCSLFDMCSLSPTILAWP